MLDYTTLTTMPGEPRGTPQFIAPEILRGDSVDHRADFYSLGVLIYHLVTKGQYPFTAQTPLALYVQVDNNPPTPPTRHNPDLSSEFENLILELLTKQPYERSFTHAELRETIRNTSLSLPAGTGQANRTERTKYHKRCLFRLLQNEKGDVERFSNAGGTMDGLEYPANFLPRMRNSLQVYRTLGFKYQFDPVTYRLAYSSFSQTQGLVSLPYVPNPDSVLTPEALRTLQQQRNYARSCVDWQLQWGCSTLVAPFHFARDLRSPWIDVDIKLIEEAVAYARSVQDAPPIYAGLCLNIEAYTVASSRLALLNRYSRTRADGYLFYVDSIDERTDNPLQLGALLDLLRLFQRLGKPVFACRVGTLGLGLLASGVDGMTTGVASLTGFSESSLLSNRATGYDMQKKYYIPGLMLTLPVPLAQDILSDQRNAHLRCDCAHCQGSHDNLDNVAKPHFLETRTEEIAQLNSLPDTPARAYWFRQRVERALQACDEVRRQGEADLRPHHYSHLRVWIRVFGTA
jgi:serine/threonine-protein kinase